ncbi:MAG: hypothetical protein K6A40_12270 [Solobacterium sp.]|nr:hypothetical protein [Solobacterium sp.]
MDHNPLTRHWFIGYTDLSSTALLPVPKSSSHWYMLAAVAVPSKTVGASPQVRRQHLNTSFIPYVNTLSSIMEKNGCFPEYSRKRRFFSRFVEMQNIVNYDDGEEKEEKRQMIFFTSSVCDLLIWIAEHSLAGTSHAGNYQPDVRALKQQLQNRRKMKKKDIRK